MSPDTRGRSTRRTPDGRCSLRRPKSTTGFWSWFTTVDHKKIGILYGGTALVFFVIGGIEALLIRLQLAGPERHGAHRVAVQHAVHDARHHDGVPRRHADGGRVRQLLRAAA